MAPASAKPLQGIDIPTTKESGIDLSVANWRGFVAPAGLAQEQKKALIEAVREMHKSKRWQQALEKHNWEDSFLVGDKFGAFLETEQKRVTGVLKDLGLV